jgi:DNA repair protein RecO (recombination protein O)
MILRSSPIGEYDRRIVLLTKEYGKISAFARGARRSNNSLGAATVPLAFGTYYAFQGRDSYTVVSADIKENFDELSKDYDLVCLASYFTEMADYFSYENMDETERLNLLFLSLKALLSDKFDPALVRRIYELRTMKISGVYPNVYSCMICGKKEDLLFYDHKRNGCICSSCHEIWHAGKPLSADLLYVLRFVMGTDLRKLFSFKLTRELMQQFENFMKEFIKDNVDHVFTSESFLS